MSQQRELTFCAPSSGDLCLDLYLPDDAKHPVPVVVWLHGGGWFTGDRTLAPDLQRRAGAMGVAIASIDYRLTDQAIFPAQILDVRSAIRYLREHAQALGLDPERIGLWGSSAGAHLAALAGITGETGHWEGEEPSAISARVQAVMAAYPPIDLAQCVTDAVAQRPGADPRMFPESRLLGGLPSDHPDLATSANPLSHLANAKDVPPFLIAHGTADTAVSSRQSVLVYTNLLQAGHQAELYLLHDYRHGFLNPGGRLEAGLKDIMDDGRLEAEGEAKARHHDAEGSERAQAFSFDTIDHFFRETFGKQ